MSFDKEMLQLMQQRIRKNLSQEEQRAVINNIVNGGGSSSRKSVQEEMFSDENDPYEYHVDIGKTDRRDEKGRVLGWDKSVHRYRTKKEEKKK